MNDEEDLKVSKDFQAIYASLTTFGHVMVNSMALARKHVSTRVRQIMLHCVRICFFSATDYGSSHNSLHDGSPNLSQT